MNQQEAFRRPTNKTIAPRTARTQTSRFRRVFRQLAQDPPGDHEPLYLAGAFIDLRDPRVPVVPLHGMVLHIPLATQNLHCLVGYLVRNLRGIELCPRPRFTVGHALVLYPRRLVYEEPGSPNLSLHIRQLERDRLVLGYGLAEGSAFRRVAHRVPEGRFRNPQSLGGYPDPARVQRPQGHPEPLALLAEPALVGHEDVIQEHIVRRGREYAHLLGVLAEGDPLFVHPHYERRNALLSPGEDDHRTRRTPVRDPLLVPREPVASLNSLGARLDGGGVGAGRGLGKGEAPDLLSPCQLRHEARPLILVSVDENRQRSRARVYRERHAHPGVGPTNLLYKQRVGEEIRPASAVLLRDAQPHKPSPGQPLEDLRRKARLPVPLGGVRSHLPVGELRRSFLNLLLFLAELEVHPSSIVFMLPLVNV